MCYAFILCKNSDIRSKKCCVVDFVAIKLYPFLNQLNKKSLPCKIARQAHTIVFKLCYFTGIGV